MYTSIIHFFLCFGFGIVGAIVTITTYHALRNIKLDPYNLDDGSTFFGPAANGSLITVTWNNAYECPAFNDSCPRQKAWMDAAYMRSLAAFIGSALVDAVL